MFLIVAYIREKVNPMYTADEKEEDDEEKVSFIHTEKCTPLPYPYHVAHVVVVLDHKKWM